jgi:hypothetical protein
VTATASAHQATPSRADAWARHSEKERRAHKPAAIGVRDNILYEESLESSQVSLLGSTDAGKWRRSNEGGFMTFRKVILTALFRASNVRGKIVTAAATMLVVCKNERRGSLFSSMLMRVETSFR